jgi:hypothetical protein
MWTTEDGPPPEVQSLRDDVVTALHAIEPSVDRNINYYPCEVVLDDGSVHPRTFVVEAQVFVLHWGVWPWSDKCIQAERIRSLRSSPQRLPARLANELYAAGESGMEYCSFSATFRSGKKLYFLNGNTADFPAWPADADPNEVIAVHPHDRHPEYRGRMPMAEESSAEYLWCRFRLAES